MPPPLKLGALAKLLEALSPIRPAKLPVRSTVQDIGTASLKGNKAKASDFYNQLAGKPGVKKGALVQIYGHYINDPKILERELFLANAKKDPLYVQKGYNSGDEMTDRDHDDLGDQAYDLFWGDPENYGPTLQDTLDSHLDPHSEQDFINGSSYLGTVTDDLRHSLRSNSAVQKYLRDNINDIHGANATESTKHAINLSKLSGGRVDGDWQNYFQHFREHAEGMASGSREWSDIWNHVADNFDYGGEGGERFNNWENYQRIARNNMNVPGYFESVLRKAPRTGRDLTSMLVRARPGEKHFNNPAQIAHARGTVRPSGNVYMEELQSDPLELFTERQKASDLTDVFGPYPGAEPTKAALSIPHADMAKAMIIQAARGGAQGISFPSTDLITSVRNPKQRPFFESIYGPEGEISRNVLGPLQKMGVPWSPEKIPRGPGAAYRPADWTRIDLRDPDLRQELGTEGLPFRRGGLARCSHQ